MIAMTLDEIAAVVGGRLSGEPGVVVGAVGTDTRTLPAGALFVALEGERDGHEFLGDAAVRGAAAVLVRDASRAPAGLPSIVVDDPMAALTRLAAGVRDRLKARVVAITGSNGKTCTKDFTAAILATSMPTAASVASFNNEIGVPLTILSATEETEALVVEIGARGIGHIASLMPIVRPDVSVVTNVGQAHVGMFGSIEGIARAKGEIVEALPADGRAVLNADDERVAAMASRTAATVVTFGRAEDATVRARDVELDDHARARFTLESPQGSAAIVLPVPGEHMVSNALAAAAVAIELGVDVGAVSAALATVTTSPHRMRVLDAPAGWRIIDDAYNASPQSVAAALKTLARLGRGRRTWAVLGRMAELGESSDEEHDRAGRLAVRLGVGRLITVGREAKAMHEAARLEGMSPDDATFAENADDAVTMLRAGLAEGDVVLVKASRVAGLERVVDALAGGDA